VKLWDSARTVDPTLTNEIPLWRLPSGKSSVGNRVFEDLLIPDIGKKRDVNFYRVGDTDLEALCLARNFERIFIDRQFQLPYLGHHEFAKFTACASFRSGQVHGKTR